MKLALAFLLLVACGGSSKPAPQPAEPDPMAECEACLASGQNWTGDTCSDSCMLDTWCFGPGNEAAPSCPEEPPTDSID